MVGQYRVTSPHWTGDVTAGAALALRSRTLNYTFGQAIVPNRPVPCCPYDDSLRLAKTIHPGLAIQQAGYNRRELRMFRPTASAAKMIIKVCLLGRCLMITTIAEADHPTLGLQQDAAGSITTLSALTLPKGAGILGFESQYISNNEISDSDLAYYAEHGEDVHSVESVSSISFNAAYGLTDKLTVGLNLPRVSRTKIREGEHHHVDEANETEPDEHAESRAHDVVNLGDSVGLGDLTLYGQYRFVGDSHSRLYASALFGVKVPTGKANNFNSEGHLFEAEHQPGSGSVDFMSGLALTRQWTKLTLDSNILFALAGDGTRASNLGDVFNYNVALSYRFSHDSSHKHGNPHHHAAGSESSWDLALEINGEWRDYVSVAGERATHTGGTVVYLAPSVHYNSGKIWSVYASLGMPLIKDLNGMQSDPTYRLFAGISVAMGSTH